jgi:ubiquilin
MSFKINIKLSGVGETFQVEINQEDTVEAIIAKCVEAREDLEAERVTLVFKGRILKIDQTAESLKLVDGVTIHLVRKPAPKGSKPAATSGAASTPAFGASASAPSTGIGATTGATGSAGASTAPNPFANMGGLGAGLPGMSAGGGASGMGGMNLDPNTINSMMGNPMFQSMMDQMMQNPDFMSSMIDNNPTLRQMADTNPQVRDLLSNPDMLRSMMTPEAIQTSMNLMNNANANSATGTLSGAPGSMAMPGGSSGASAGAATGTGAAGSSATGAASSAPATGASAGATTGKYLELSKNMQFLTNFKI